ncbi:MAG: hypothetical protein WCI12_10905, partial [Actinomycetes bacterium]
PIAPSVELKDRAWYWVPPPGQPLAPKSTWIRVRRLDGVHLCTPGITLFSTALTGDTSLAFGWPRPPSTWANGSWQDAPVLTSAAGFCPDDQPGHR